MNKLVDSYLKNLSESIALNDYVECVRQTSLRTMAITHGPMSHLIPSASDKMWNSFYRKAKQYMPEEYLENGRKAVMERLQEVHSVQVRPAKKSFLARVFSDI